MNPIRREYWFLGCAFIVLTFSTVAWTLADRTPPAWDPADHLRTAYDFFQPLSQGRFFGFFRELVQEPHPYAPLFHLMTACVFLVAGVSRLSGIVANFAGLAILLYSVNALGDKLYAESLPASCSSFMIKPGAIAALLAVCYHFPAWLIHDAFLDYLLMAMVALAFALLLRADQFHVRSDAVLFGVIVGLGMLEKQTFLFFFILPLSFLGARALMRRDRKAIANLALAMAIMIAIAALWYVPHWGDILGIYRVNVLNAAAEHESPILSSYSFAYYWAVLTDLHLQLPFSLLFFAGCTYSIRRRLQKDWMLYLWILSGILAFTFIENKDTRYAVPILPAVALLSVSWLNKIRPNLRLLATGALITWAMISFMNAQWPSRAWDARIHVLGEPVYILAADTVRFDHHPMSADWSIPAIVRAANGTLGVVPNLWQLNASNIALYARQYGLPVEVEWLGNDEVPDLVKQCDYVLVRTRFVDTIPTATAEKNILAYLSDHSDRFTSVAVFSLPYSQEAVLFKRLF